MAKSVLQHQQYMFVVKWLLMVEKVLMMGKNLTLTGYNFLNRYLTLRSFHYSLYVRVYCPGDVHWAHLEASALRSLIAACTRMEEKSREERKHLVAVLFRRPMQRLQQSILSCGLTGV